MEKESHLTEIGPWSLIKDNLNKRDENNVKSPENQESFHHQKHFKYFAVTVSEVKNQ